MANGKDSENYRDCSEIRPGMKREFAMMISQSQYIGTIGRTRSSRSSAGRVIQKPTIKRNKSSSNPKVNENNKIPDDFSLIGEKKELTVDKSIENEAIIVVSEEEEPKSDIVDAMSEDEKKNNLDEESKGFKEFKIEDQNLNVDVKSQCKGGDSGEVIGENAFPQRRFTRSVLKPENEEVVESNMMSSGDVIPAAADNKSEMKMSPKKFLKKPKMLKELLETGLLEGFAIRYLRGSRVRGPMDNGLCGIIKGAGILCYCDMCNGTEVVSPNHFELHAGSANKRPPDYIYLENRKNLRDVLNACKDVPLDAIEVTILNAIGCSSVKKHADCQNCQGPLLEAGDDRRALLCGSCMESEPGSPQQSDNNDRSLVSLSNSKSYGRKVRCRASPSKGQGILTLKNRNAHCSSSRSKGQGRLTLKDLRLHKRGFELLAEGAEVAYYNKGKKVLEGYKKGQGIFCFCCNSEVSPSQFEAHAGFASRRKPYLHIFTSNGVSLHEWSFEQSKERKSSPSESDDLCSICHDGGKLLLCDACPRAFHVDCISLPDIPSGAWHCRYCKINNEKSKFERNANAVAAGRVPGIDPIEQITSRCIRIVGSLEVEIGGCVLCRGHDFSNSGFGPRTVIICDQCEKEYHIGCLKEHKMEELKELPQGKWFCCTECNSIHSALQNLVANGEIKLPDSLLNVIKKKYSEKGLEGCGDLDIRWRLLCGKTDLSDETRVLLSKAVAIFHDRFDPIADSGTSHLDFIPHMVYGRNSKDQEFGGMYCAILTVNSYVVSAGLIRIFGQQVAELPLVATSNDYQGMGYFQSLFSCMENLLGSLSVKDLVLPSADEAESIWTNKFGFNKIDLEQLKLYRRDYQMMVFQGTSMLHKRVTRG